MLRSLSVVAMAIRGGDCSIGVLVVSVLIAEVDAPGRGDVVRIGLLSNCAGGCCRFGFVGGNNWMCSSGGTAMALFSEAAAQVGGLGIWNKKRATRCSPIDASMTGKMR